MSERYIPTVPKFVAELLTKEKQNGWRPIILFGDTRRAFKDWKHRYSRKYKYAKLNGWQIESEAKS